MGWVIGETFVKFEAYGLMIVWTGLRLVVGATGVETTVVLE